MQEPGIEEVKVKVDSAVARDNVSRAAKALGWQVQVTAEGDHFFLTLKH